jgi:uncharacterized secreted protein with C-terminal beta-propeller domain
MRRLPTLLTTLGLGLGACAEDKATPPIVDTSTDRLDWGRPAALTAARTCDEALTGFRAAAITQMELELDRTMRCYLQDGGCGRFAEDGGAPTAGETSNAGASPQDDATPDEYSETNTQVEGVDEADFVKTTGERIYAIFGRDLVIMKSWPAAETAELARVRLSASPHSFFLAGNRAVVLGWASFYDFLDEAAKAEYDQGLRAWDYRMWQGGTLVTVINLENDTPVVESEHLVGGYLVGSRRIDDKVYLAQNDYVWIDGVQYWPDNLAWDAPDAEIEATFAALKARNRTIIEDLPLDWWLPVRHEVVNGRVDMDAPGLPLTDCEDVYVPNVYTGQSLLSVVTYDLAQDTFEASTVNGEWGHVYMSQDALYVASTNWGWYWWWEGTADTERPPITTHIHKFGLGDDGVARHKASGNVLGYAINQFAFDEHDGHLRVATTDGFGWWNTGTTTESRVTVLSEDGAQLREEGVVAGLGKGETIQSVRFVGPQGYVVTFRQVDPLYVLDLANPAAPTVAGELKIPGFSSYIHPIEDGHLLTIGRDANDQGQVGGMKLEIFDVRDPAAPKSVKTEVLGDSWNTWSEAQWDHHAFVYFPARKLLGIPVSGWENPSENDWRYKSELFVFKVGLDEIQQIGAVSHVDLLADLGVNTACRSWYGWWEAYIRRAVFIEDYVYSVSNIGVAVHDTRDFGKGAVSDLVGIAARDFQGGYYSDPCGERVDDGAETPKDDPEGER